METTATSPKYAITSDDELIWYWMVTKELVCICFIGMSMLRGVIFIGIEEKVKVIDVKESDIGKSSF